VESQRRKHLADRLGICGGESLATFDGAGDHYRKQAGERPTQGIMGGRSELVVMHHRRHQPGEDPLGAFIADEGPCAGQ
jgi:hypothetical protein